DSLASALQEGDPPLRQVPCSRRAEQREGRRRRAHRRDASVVGDEELASRRDRRGGQVTPTTRVSRTRWGAQGGAWPRPQSRPCPTGTNAPCVLASHHPARPSGTTFTGGGGQ